jgi:uncharacterized phage protein (TIGR01671 family)
MRELKFRAWQKRLKEIYSVTGYHVNEDIYYCESKKGTCHTFGLIDLEVMQYTGLKDKSGAEIYEGDIVEHRSDLSSASEVKYFEGAFIAGSPLTSNALINFNCANNVLVIGNIYENKELIK